VWRIPTAPADLVNTFAFMDDDGQVTLVDAGVKRATPRIVAGLEHIGAAPTDVTRIVITHAHPDHVGFAERLRTEHLVPVLVHEADEEFATGRRKNTPGKVRMRLGPMLGFGWWGARRGLLRVPPLVEVSTFGDGATLDLPGSPRVILVPGHTPGSAALHVASRDALFVGDAIATYSVNDGYRGPRMAAFGADYSQARESLDRLRGIAARMVLPGHGDAFTGGVDEAVRLAREAPFPG